MPKKNKLGKEALAKVKEENKKIKSKGKKSNWKMKRNNGTEDKKFNSETVLLIGRKRTEFFRNNIYGSCTNLSWTKLGGFFKTFK